MKNKCSGIWIIVWSVMFVLGLMTNCRELLCNKGFQLINGEYYRVFTGLLIHINWFHLLANIVAMYYICVFLHQQVNSIKMFVFSVLAGVITYFIFSAIYVTNYSIGGSPAVFALIALMCVLQLQRKDLPRFRLGTRYGNWILGYAILGNLPWFSKDASTLIIHSIAFGVAFVLGTLVVKLRIL